MPEHTGVFKRIKSYLDRNRIGELLVARQVLTPAQLKAALSQQRFDQRPLGQILVDYGYVTRNQIRSAIATQLAFRCMMTTATLMISLTAISPRTAQAGSNKDVPQQIQLASTAMPSVAAYPELFGSGERRSADLSAFTKWAQVFDRFDRDAKSASGSKILADWKNDIEPLRGLPLEDMAERVNTLMNKIKYISDNRNWGRSDYWATPVEFMTRGGDCEDFAIAKYASLRALGVPEDRLRLAIVKDLEKGIPHAILIVYTDNGAMVLDNQIKTMRKASSIRHYKPIFSINRRAWWLHTSPKATVIASAAGE